MNLKKAEKLQQTAMFSFVLCPYPPHQASLSFTTVDEAIGAVDRWKCALFARERPPNVECSVESTGKRNGRSNMEVNARISQASHWIGKPDKVKPNLGLRV